MLGGGGGGGGVEIYVLFENTKKMLQFLHLCSLIIP